jgi:hypothetical protein
MGLPISSVETSYKKYEASLVTTLTRLICDAHVKADNGIIDWTYPSP